MSGADSKRTEALARKQYFDAAAGVTPMLAAESRAGATYLVSTRDKGVGRSLFMRRHRGEMDLLAAAIRTLEELGQKEEVTSKTFVDVGANIGTSTIPALCEHGFAGAVAFEPGPENFALLRMNLIANGLDDRVRALPLALSDKRGTVELGLSNDNWGDHRVLDPRDRRAGRNGRQVIEVSRTTLDCLIADRDLVADEIGLVWIDAQGHESRILRGARAVLELGVPVVFEFFPKLLAHNGTLASLQAKLARMDRVLVDLRDMSAGKLLPFPCSSIAELTERYLASGRVTDLMLLPASRSGEDGSRVVEGEKRPVAVAKAEVGEQPVTRVDGEAADAPAVTQ